MKSNTRKSATLTIPEIQKWIKDGYKINAYGSKDGYISEISFSKDIFNSGLIGFSFDVGCGIRQRELKSLFNRIKKVSPKIKVKI